MMVMDTKEKHHEHGKGDRHEHGKPGFQKGYSQQEETKDDMRLIVRISGIDLDGNKPIDRALTKIKGIGVRMGKNIAVAFEKSAGISMTRKTGSLSEEESKKLEEVVQNPVKFGVPEWSLNRRKDFYTGASRHMVMSDLDLTLRGDLQRMTETKSYKGLRHAWGLPVRGQRTKSTHRGKGGIVGVVKKEQAKSGAAASPKSAGAAAPMKKDEKKK